MFRVSSQLQMNKYEGKGDKNDQKLGRLKLVYNLMKKNTPSISLLVLRRCYEYILFRNLIFSFGTTTSVSLKKMYPCRAKSISNIRK